MRTNRSVLPALITVLALLMVVYSAVRLLPRTAERTAARIGRARRALRAIGGRYRTNVDGKIISVTLSHIDDGSCTDCLKLISGDLESLTLEDATIECQDTVVNLGLFSKLLELRIIGNSSFKTVIPVKAFPALRCLIVADSTLALRSLEEFPLSRLNVLKISGCNIGDETLRTIAEIGTLRELLLSRNPRVTDHGVAHLGRLPELRKLFLYHTSISGSAFSAFSSESMLRILYVYDTPFDSAGCKYVGRLKELRVLAAGETRVSDVGVCNLAGLRKLERLNIPLSAITEKSVKCLEAMPHLQTLGLFSIPGDPRTAGARLRVEWFRNWKRTCIGGCLVLERVNSHDVHGRRAPES